ncbi:hypothetical protein ACIA8O_27240 [Kitasatospora sp. NPDC051853]|uniref:hypothetical protein n=1 Tax=Kitasatospora sp. NPDC051853 TaxID=3364058 RepID=UPI00379E2883
MLHPAPPLPDAPPLTPEAAARWRSARTAHRWDSRRLGLLPLGLILLLLVVPTGPEFDEAPHWYASVDAVVAALLLQALALRARPRGLPLAAYALLPLLWYAPGAPDGAALWVLLLAEAALAALLTVAALGRRRARRQLAELMGPEVPYPWTLAGHPSPFADHPSPPAGRVVLGAVLLAGAAALQLADPTVLVVTAGLAGLGLVCLASAAKAVRIRRALVRRPGAPALRVLFQPGYGPQAGPLAGPPLWELTLHEEHVWEDGRWLPWPGTTVPEDDEEEDDCDCDEAVDYGPPVPALLYQGPDGPHAQLLVRPHPATDEWSAWLATPDVRPGNAWSAQAGRFELATTGLLPY